MESCSYFFMTNIAMGLTENGGIRVNLPSRLEGGNIAKYCKYFGQGERRSWDGLPIDNRVFWVEVFCSGTGQESTLVAEVKGDSLCQTLVTYVKRRVSIQWLTTSNIPNKLRWSRVAKYPQIRIIKRGHRAWLEGIIWQTDHYFYLRNTTVEFE